MSTFVERIKTEHKELEERLNKLYIFMDSDLFHRLPTGEQHLLDDQSAAMAEYKRVLLKRLDMYRSKV